MQVLDRRQSFLPPGCFVVNYKRRKRIMEGWELIQNCHIKDTDLYNRQQFISLIEHLTPHDFNLFCKTYLHLQEFYGSNVGAWVTDYPPLVAANPDLYWELKPIDFNEPVNFVRRK